METISITAERKAQLEEYARRNGQDPATALDAALAEYLSWERLDYQESVAAIQDGFDDLRSGDTQPTEEVFEELRLKHGLPR
jgi:predicted transcriptional regulator